MKNIHLNLLLILTASCSTSQAYYKHKLQQIDRASKVYLGNNVLMNKRTAKTLGHKVKLHRKQRGLLQVELADIVGVSTGYVGAIEQGVRLPSLKLLNKIAKALKVPVHELLK